MHYPLVSVILPVYNGAAYVAEAIDSVLAQSYRPYELIVVDDGSSDDSTAIAEKYDGVTLLCQSNQGVAAARNTGLAASQGEFFAFLDQDDRWTPDKLRIQMHYLLDHPHIQYVIAKQRIFLEPGTEAPGWLKKDILRKAQAGFLPGTLVARRDVFDHIGRFDPTYQVTSDADWFFRAKDAGIPMAALDEVLLLKRIHGANESYRAKRSNAELLQIARNSMKRKRSNPVSGRTAHES